ncbi:hypothetical protein MMC17_004555 [Xylographa soralifera]|nr:hypothetical protein [Xylographa soralifera]
MKLSLPYRGLTVAGFASLAALSFTQALLQNDLRLHHKQLHHVRSAARSSSGGSSASESFGIGETGAIPNAAVHILPRPTTKAVSTSVVRSSLRDVDALKNKYPYQGPKITLKVRTLEASAPESSILEEHHHHHKTCGQAPHSKLFSRNAQTEATIKKRQATSDSICPATNGTTYTSSAGAQYQIICNINIPNQDLPFQTVATFGDCVSACDTINSNAGEVNCLAAIFTPNRVNDANDCYLKYATDNATPADALLDGAILIISPSAAQSSVSNSGTTTGSSTGYGPAPSYASGKFVIVPEVAYSQLHGPTQNYPTNQYIDITLPPDLTLMQSLLTVGIEVDLSIDYPISPDTGVLPLNSTTIPLLADLTDTPHLSRDGGKGGLLDGANLFIFCDTGSYSTTTDNTNGNFLAFVSSSVATDTGMYALYGNPIHLEDGIGEWSDNVGRMRGFSPLTAGEQGYNLAMQGQGQRYAIWPESSIIPLDGQSAILFAPIVYDNVDMTTRVATFTYTGATLLTVTAGGGGGPIAERTVDRIWEEDEVEWGCVGGIRSWGSSGRGGSDGMVYIFGNVRGGLLLAKAPPSGVTNRNSYQYWTGNSWSYGMQAPTSTAYFIAGSFMDVDVFYSPRHLTFIIVYMTIYADSTFYYRYLQADQAILPPFAPGGNPSEDYVANILQYNWSEEYTLYKTGTGLGGAYTYAGSVHQGYFGADDIVNGGSKMLLSWTAPTGLDPASETSEYQIITAEIDWV